MTEAHIRQGEQSSRTTFSFDLNGQMTQVACTGQHIDFRYDATGRLIEECLNGQAVAYEYDANGNRLKTRLPSGDTLGYFYYGSGHLSGIKFNHQLITDIHRNALHQEICRSQGGLTTHYQYNPLGQLIHQQTDAHPQNTLQIDRTYGYDELGHLIQTRTHCPQQPFEAPHQTQYQYDSLGRIQQEKTGTQRHTFYFDPASNLINDPTEKVINNRLSHYQGVRYTYDSLGNLTECQTANGDYQRYTYDLKNRLIRADIHNRYTTESWVYDYDPLGRRIAKSKLNKQGEKQCHMQFIWAGSHLVQEIRKGNHQQNAEKTDRTFIYIYTHPDSYEPLAQCYKESENAQHTVNYFHCDQIGIPREMTDSQGKLLWKGRYDAWGQLIHDSNRHAQRTAHQPFRLQNQYFDQETGLHYNFLRYYEPALGLFITQDPIGLMGGMNLYQFAANTQTWVDEFGLISKKKLPCFEQLRDAYPNFNIEPSARPSSDSYAVNQCAIRVSSAMQKTGIDIKNLYPKGNQTSEGYARSSKGLADWIWKNYGKPKQMSLSDFANNSINLKGIFYELPKEDSIGHIDIIDQGKVGSGFYDAKEIWFWPMEDCK